MILAINPRKILNKESFVLTLLTTKAIVKYINQ
jgi:hypothetical protein